MGGNPAGLPIFGKASPRALRSVRHFQKAQEHWERILRDAMRGPETEVHEEIFMERSLLRVERKRQKEDAKAGYTKLDH